MVQPTSHIPASVAVIDDDESVRESMCSLFRSVGLPSEGFGSVDEFHAAGQFDRIGCIVCDIRLPGQSGLEFAETIRNGNHVRPVVLISAFVDVQMAVRAMKSGAVDVLTKPFREQDLLEAVNRAIDQDQRRRMEAERTRTMREKFATLTDRERQVMALVIIGLQNKQIADRVGITEATVKLHRGQVMRKMDALSVVDLVRIADVVKGLTLEPK